MATSASTCTSWSLRSAIGSRGWVIRLAATFAASLRLARSAVLAASAALALPEAGTGQLLRPRLEVEPYVGGFFAGDLELQELKDSPLVGARLGVRLPLGVGLEGQLGWAPLESERVGVEQPSFDVTVWLLEAGIVYGLPLPGPIEPFLGLAAGRARFDPELRIEGDDVGAEASWVASAGAGVRLALGSWGLRADLRDHLILDALDETARALGGEGGETLNVLEASLGVSFFF